MAELPFVSVIIVNFNGREHLTGCLRSVAAQDYPRHRFETIVVDNASTDDSVELVRQSFPWVTLLRLGENRGFAGGNNAGIAAARGEWLALLNADAAADRGWLRAGILAGEAGHLGAVASRLVFRDDPWMLNSTGLELYHDGRSGDRDCGSDTACERGPGTVFGGCGAAVFLRRAAVDALGGFDERLFLYWEDLDLAWRLRRAGWEIGYAPSARATHVGSGTIGRASATQTRYVERNRVLVNVRHAPLFIGVLSGLGLVARSGRSVGRWLSGRTGFSQVIAHARALVGMLALLPWFVVDRLSRGGADRLYRQWSRPVPR